MKEKYPYITRDDDVRSGHPIVEGTRIGVHDVAGMVAQGSSIDDVVASFPSLTRAQVYACMAYYEDHRDEIDPLIAAQAEERQGEDDEDDAYQATPATRRLTVKYSELEQAFDFQSEMNETYSYLDTRSGAFVTLQAEELRAAEGEDPEDEREDDVPEWQQEMIAKAADYLENQEHFIELPSKFDFHEYSVMERFALSIEDEKVRNDVLRSMKGRGAFRRFKDAIHRWDIAEAWYEYRDRAVRKLLSDWCASYGITLVDDKGN